MVQLRYAHANDLGYIYDTFLKSMRHGSSLGKQTAPLFFKNFCPVIDHILDTSDVSVACLAEDPNVILGYILYQLPNIVYYIFVKQAFRRLGVAKSLVDKAFAQEKNEGFEFTCLTCEVPKILKKHPEIRYNPFNLYMRKQNE